MDEYYKTSDLAVAAALHSVGLRLESIDRANTSRAVFCFVIPNETDIQAIVNSYWDGSLTLSARLYSASLKELKARLYA